MGRNKLPAEEAATGTISFRVVPSILRRYEDAIAETGVSKSDVFRILIRDASDADIVAAINSAQVEQIHAIQTASLSELKQKRVAAQKTIAWIDAQLNERAAKVSVLNDREGNNNNGQ